MAQILYFVVKAEIRIPTPMLRMVVWRINRGMSRRCALNTKVNCPFAAK